MPADPLISARSVNKTFKLPTERRDRLKEHVVHLFRPIVYHEFEALHDVSLSVDDGEFFSIVGHNGSGKSTLLKILAGIYRPTSGQVEVRGRLSPFIELGVGFNPELTARDNVYLNGTILGLERRQIAAQFDDIIGFAELEPFVDLKLKNYSSGMLVRLAFSVAIRAHAEILLIDEVLAVGDASFQLKCFDVFRRLRAEGKTIVFVSHDLNSVMEFSDRVMVLDHGHVVGTYAPAAGIAVYQQLNEEKASRDLARSAAASTTAAPTAPTGANGNEPRPSIRTVATYSGDGQPARVFHRGDDLRVVVAVDNPHGAELNASVGIFRSDGLQCFSTSTFDAELTQRTGDSFELTCSDLPLQRGTYHLLVGLFGKTRATVHEYQDHVCDFQVAQWDDYEGVCYVHHRWAGEQPAERADASRDQRPGP
ncbi:MAG TPA: ABC transporter ATP-binding protein [Candidatus Dormibacteraeota bacterium]|nr:ABC transporter ATP-binding protein [Candidatus Dormibacteraeota bacterium]